MILDAVGVGAGPSNLSLAALAEKVPELSLALLERCPDVRWHGGILLPGTRLQVSLFKDLVSLVDPTSPHSFVAFLHAHGRLLQFVHCGFDRVLRSEFDQYLRWISHRLGCVAFGQTVREITYDGTFLIRSDHRQWRARNVVLGTGRGPWIPPCCRAIKDATVVHSERFTSISDACASKRVCVVGGGQSGAEVVYDLLSRTAKRPKEVIWVSRRQNFQPLDETCFTDELFTPSFSNYFFDLPLGHRERLIKELKLASDGISSRLIRDIYQQIYRTRFLDDEPVDIDLIPNFELCGVNRDDVGWRLRLAGPEVSPPRTVQADIVILATGYHYELPEFLNPVLERITLEKDAFVLNTDYSIVWKVPTNGKIYALNAALLQRGIADPNLSLLAWRSAITVNSLAGRAVYRLACEDRLIEWCGPPALTEEHRRTA
jgi:lysine N6-hydroxylase